MPRTVEYRFQIQIRVSKLPSRAEHKLATRGITALKVSSKRLPHSFHMVNSRLAGFHAGLRVAFIPSRP